MNFDKSFEISQHIMKEHGKDKLELHSLKGDHKTSKILLLASLLKIPSTKISMNYLNPDTYSSDSSFKKISPNFKSPVLQEENNFSLYETNSILRYLAKHNQRDELLGTTLKEQALVDQWLEYISSELDPLLQVIYFPYVNLTDFDERQSAAFGGLEEEFEVLENKLRNKKFLVGYGVTLADVSLAACLLCPFGAIFKKFFKKKFTVVASWIDFISAKLEVESVLDSFRSLQVDILDGDFGSVPVGRGQEPRNEGENGEEIVTMKSDIQLLKEKMFRMEDKMTSLVSVIENLQKEKGKKF